MTLWEQPQLPRHLQVTEPEVGDQVIYKGHQYWLLATLTIEDDEIYALRQAHWGPGHNIMVDKKDVLLDVPFTA